MLAAARLCLLALGAGAVGCARLPALAVAGRLHVVTERHAAARSVALVVGCGWKLDPDAVTRARASEPPPGIAPGTEPASVGCTDAALCAWQRAQELGAAQVLLPIAEESGP